MKYPRTPHFHWSKGGTADDIRLVDLKAFSDLDLVVTEKLDGEQTTLTNKAIHARSEDGYGLPWQTYMKKMWANIKNDIPNNLEICGECVYAVHSIEYKKLDSIFYVFGVFENGFALSWKEVEEYAELLGLSTVPELNFGRIQDFIEMPIPNESVFGGECEGYVIRNINSFLISDFKDNIAKCVRKNHVSTDKHWRETWKKQDLTYCKNLL